MSLSVVTVWKRKRPAGWCRWQAYDLESDSFGTWLFTPARSNFIRSDGVGNTRMFEHWEDREGHGRPSLVLLPRDGWFVGHWTLSGDHLIDVDISTPPQRSGSDWIFEDLELDPYVLLDGTYGVEDEDEFAEAVGAGLITDDERETAERTVDVLRAELTHKNSRLLAAGQRRLAMAIDLGLDPLLASLNTDFALPAIR